MRGPLLADPLRQTERVWRWLRKSPVRVPQRMPLDCPVLLLPVLLEASPPWPGALLAAGSHPRWQQRRLWLRASQGREARREPQPMALPRSLMGPR